MTEYIIFFFLKKLCNFASITAIKRTIKEINSRKKLWHSYLLYNFALYENNITTKTIKILNQLNFLFILGNIRCKSYTSQIQNRWYSLRVCDTRFFYIIKVLSGLDACIRQTYCQSNYISQGVIKYYYLAFNNAMEKSDRYLLRLV